MSTGSQICNVVIAGIGGASLGTELAKCLRLSRGYKVIGADVSPTAFGLYDENFDSTFLIDRDNYIEEIIRVCRQNNAEFVVPGGEQPMTLLGAANEQLLEAGVRLIGNSPEIIGVFSNKIRASEYLSEAGVATPRTAIADLPGALELVGLPCVIKPATGSGGSASVFFATNADEALTYAQFIRRSGTVPLAQEYIDAGSGEFTVGVLSLPNGQVAGSIGLRRTLDAKLSVSYRGRGGLISSGYSQGHIGEYALVRQQAEAIALAIGSRGPINVQGRMRGDVFVPFEINPRFSASTYLRAMAGFNELDVFIRFTRDGEYPKLPPIRYGWYLRSLTERFVSDTQLKTGA
ncbi:ATP-grasp domain-containing protein [Rhizobium sp. 21-4511-3d]